jgi:DNA-binding NarL/FixJ family response regulator
MSCSFCDPELDSPNRALEASARAPDAAALPAARLDELLARLRRTEGLAEDELLALAWECFAAGFAARRASLTESGVLDARDHVHAEPHREQDLGALVASLSPRRLEVLGLVAKGLTNSEIASVLGISACTVKAHVAGILQALDLTNRTEAAVALQEYESKRIHSQVAH